MGKITGNKLDAELVIMESEKVIEEELCASPPKYEKPKRHCPKCQDASRYKNQMATTKPRKFKAGEIECYPNFKAWFNDLPSYMTSGKKKKLLTMKKIEKYSKRNVLVKLRKSRRERKEIMRNYETVLMTNKR